MSKLILILLVLSPYLAKAQYGESIRSGRPGQAIGAFTVGKNVLQIQSGVTFDWSDADGSNLESNSTSGVTVVRYGLTEQFEISTVWGVTGGKQTFENQSASFSGLNNAQLGFRFNIRDGQGQGGPNIGIQTRLRLNVLGDDFDQQELASTTILAVTQSLSSKLGLTTNLGITWDGNSGAAKGLYVVNLSTPLNDRSSFFVENYGNLTNGDLDLRFDTGLDYVVNRDLKFDFSLGYGSNDHVKDYFIDFGVSWRTLTKARTP